ncbi:MAG: glycoside hydrolase family 3 C-terminal domain-containing protein [Spirochaetaceae bacterium]|jgi:beta-glucosidase|nr:glycoside hydrolase family 3 C-terminal domain-containing protein [Spirochaetaceae bacterium]
MGKRAKDLVAEMTLEEKASLCSGRDFWFLKGIPRLGLEPIMVTDGPHGLRKQAAAADHLGINQSVPATCFPTAAASACSFDRKLLEEIGRAIGEECLAEEVAVILGPGANIKRSPFCGRNFEYFSEDPLLSGEMAAALIKGVQSQGVGTSLKHYAANNQETCRMVVNAVIDERALREIYLAGFERAVKQAKPWTLMCSYNRVNGVYASENKKLLTSILRDEWGFEGLVMTDWGATNDRVLGLEAGLDLEMPGSGGVNDAKILEAVKKGLLDEGVLDRAAERVTDLILKARERQGAAEGSVRSFDATAHHALARRAARESAVLLKNDGILPVASGVRAALIGAFAKQPRYQGAGSSRINPASLDNAHDALREGGLDFEYAPGYSLEPGSPPDPKLIGEAVDMARGKDLVLLFAGLPDDYESEGFDRNSLAMPESHTRLIEAVTAANSNTVVILQCGAPVELPWAGRVKGILLAYLGGQAGGSACADLLLGRFSPSGKLAETFPLRAEDNPSFPRFPGTSKTVEYRESIFTGYRYYDTAKVAPAYPFGFGLSYTTFEYRNLRISAPQWKPGEVLSVSLDVRNTGSCGGAEIVLLYLGIETSRIFRAEKELAGFEKIYLEPGETGTLSFTLDTRSFSYYNVPAASWAVEGGVYRIMAAASGRDIRLQGSVTVAGDGREEQLGFLAEKAPAYYRLASGELKIPPDVPDADFEALYGGPLPPDRRLPDEPYTINSTLNDIGGHPAGKAFRDSMLEGIRHAFSAPGDESLSRMFEAMLEDMPLRGLTMMSQGQLTPDQAAQVLAALNGS